MCVYAGEEEILLLVSEQTFQDSGRNLHAYVLSGTGKFCKILSF